MNLYFKNEFSSNFSSLKLQLQLKDETYILKKSVFSRKLSRRLELQAWKYDFILNFMNHFCADENNYLINLLLRVVNKDKSNCSSSNGCKNVLELSNFFDNQTGLVPKINLRLIACVISCRLETHARSCDQAVCFRLLIYLSLYLK